VPETATLTFHHFMRLALLAQEAAVGEALAAVAAEFAVSAGVLDATTFTLVHFGAVAAAVALEAIDAIMYAVRPVLVGTRDHFSTTVWTLGFRWLLLGGHDLGLLLDGPV
jgi:hypothetical protein